MKVVSTGLYSVIKNKDEYTIYGTYYNLNSLEHDRLTHGQIDSVYVEMVWFKTK
jgi:hypothetical protein